MIIFTRMFPFILFTGWQTFQLQLTPLLSFNNSLSPICATHRCLGVERFTSIQPVWGQAPKERESPLFRNYQLPVTLSSCWSIQPPFLIHNKYFLWVHVCKGHVMCRRHNPYSILYTWVLSKRRLLQMTLVWIRTDSLSTFNIAHNPLLKQASLTNVGNSTNL